jgi:trehalose-6-phosphate synthase
MAALAAASSTEDARRFPLPPDPLSAPPLDAALFLISFAALPRGDCSALACAGDSLRGAAAAVTSYCLAGPADDAGAAPPGVTRVSFAGAAAARAVVDRWLLPALHALPLPTAPAAADEAGWEALAEGTRALAAAVMTAARGADPARRLIFAVVGPELMLLPALLRAELAADFAPRAPHSLLLVLPTSFASADVFACLPPRAALLAGALGADAVALPDAEFARELANAAVQALGVDADPLRIVVPGAARRVARVVVAPLGLFGSWESGEVSSSADVDAEAARIALQAALRARHGRSASAADAAVAAIAAPPAIVATLASETDEAALSLLLAAVAAFFTRHPASRGRVTFVVLIRAAAGDDARAAARRARVDEAVGRVLGAVSSTTWEPLVLLRAAAHAAADVRALFASAAVGLFTPAAAGAATDALAYVAAHARATEAAAGGSPPPGGGALPGVLVLGAAVGGARLLSGALLARPNDPAAVADAVAAALAMPPAARRARHKQLLAATRFFSGAAWAARALSAAHEAAEEARALAAAAAAPPPTPAAVAAAWRGGARGGARVLLASLGALCPRGAPLRAAPAAALRALAAAGVSVVLWSGRPSGAARALGAAALGGRVALAAARGAAWAGWAPDDVEAPWAAAVAALLRDAAARVPGGSLVADGATLTLRWPRGARAADGGAFGAAVGRDTVLTLRALTADAGRGAPRAEAVLDARRALIAVRPAGLGAAALCARLREAAAGGARVLALVARGGEGGGGAGAGEGEGACEGDESEGEDAADEDELRRAADVGVACASRAEAERWLAAIAAGEQGAGEATAP